MLGSGKDTFYYFRGLLISYWGFEFVSEDYILLQAVPQDIFTEESVS